MEKESRDWCEERPNLISDSVLVARQFFPVFTLHGVLCVWL